MKLGLAGGGGACPALGAVLLALAAGGSWNEPDRKMPSESGRGLRVAGGGGWGFGAAGRSPYDFLVAESLT